MTKRLIDAMRGCWRSQHTGELRLDKYAEDMFTVCAAYASLRFPDVPVDRAVFLGVVDAGTDLKVIARAGDVTVFQIGEQSDQILGFVRDKGKARAFACRGVADLKAFAAEIALVRADGEPVPLGGAIVGIYPSASDP